MSADLWTLREVYTAVRRALRDGDTGTTTAVGTTTSLVSSRFAGGSNNAWVGSEIYIFNPPNTTNPNPLTVTAFAASNGTFTYAGQAWGANSQVGVQFIVGNRDGQGWRHEEVIDAITVAIRRQRNAERATDDSTIVTASQTWEYATPAGWEQIERVEYRPSGGDTTQWLPIPPASWRFDKEDGRLRFRVALENNLPIRITGRTTPTVPSAMTDLAYADGATIRDDALFELLSRSDDQGDRQVAAMMQPGVIRARVGSQFGRMG